MLQLKQPGLDQDAFAQTAERFSALLKRVAEQRDRNAFAQIFDHYAPRIFGYLLRLGVEPAQAEDLTQDVLTTAWHKAGQFDPAKASPATWLFRIARNRRIDLARRSRDTSMVNDDTAFDIPDQTPAADSTMNAAQRDAITRTALEELPAEQLALVRLAFFEELSHSDIAIRTNLPLGTVKSRLRLAFSKLRRVIEERGVDGV